MARLAERDYTYLTTVRGMCRGCRRIVPARVFERGGGVWQQALCPDCGPGREPALIAADAAWYLANVPSEIPDRSPLPGARPPARGCPHDCGPCAFHASPCQLPVVSITNACSLRCPICFTYNRPDRTWHIEPEQMGRIVDRMIAATGPLDLIDITGGEPTLHPRLIEVLDACRRPEIGRVMMNSNGLRLAEDFDLCRRLADRGVCVVLSLSALDRATSLRLHGADVTEAKLAAIDNLARAGARMALLSVLVGGVNEDVLGPAIELLTGRDHILSLTIQTMTFTGQGGGGFPRTGHVPVDAAARLVAERSAGQIAFDDFVARPSAHPLCYLICYALRTARPGGGHRLVPFTRFAEPAAVRSMLADSYLVRPAESDAFFTDAINRLYAAGDAAALAELRRLVERLYPPPGGEPIGRFERQRLAESAVRAVYVHAHMDEDTFDCSRALACPDQAPEADGRLVPACTYNLFYRMADERFYAPPPAEGDL